jgi:metal-responsive CopG/Arc/MetJ family transcriptional regulator
LGYNYLVRVKTSITLPEELLKSIDQVGQNRSAFIERACRTYLARLTNSGREADDIAIINAHADQLNKEAVDVLEYQCPPFRRT